MLSKRTWIGIGLGVIVVAAVANINWLKVERVTYLDGGVQRQYRILGKFTYVATVEDPRTQASRQVSDKFKSYGLERFSGDGSAVIEIARARTEFTLFKEGQGDIVAEAATLGKEMPWLTQLWNGSHHTNFYARGNHPKLGGYVEVSCSRLPERKHGPGKLRFTIAVTE